MHGTFKTIKTKADPFSLETLIAWLEKQPLEGKYYFFSTHNCLLARYFKAQGFSKVEVSGFSVLLDGTWCELPLSFRRTATTSPTWKFWLGKFGASLATARSYL